MVRVSFPAWQERPKYVGSTFACLETTERNREAASQPESRRRVHGGCANVRMLRRSQSNELLLLGRRSCYTMGARQPFALPVPTVAKEWGVPMASTYKHIILSVPDDWNNDQKGDFYETFVADLLRPQRLRVIQRIRFTGMEIDLLAEDEDQPRTILVECKALRDPLPSEVVTKLMGNVWLRKADAGWLFSTSDLSKDGKGCVEDIANDLEQAKRFAWFSPERIVEILISQEKIVDPLVFMHHFDGLMLGDWTLVITPSRNAWLAQIVRDGMPSQFAVFDASSISDPLPVVDAQGIARLSPRFSSLTVLQTDHPTSSGAKSVQGQVARVISADKWDDLRPARPMDFVGRDDLVDDAVRFISQVRLGETKTRIFAISGPSGWGKSSLILKICDEASRSKTSRCSMTAVDARSAANASFVSASLREALLDASRNGLLPKDSEYRVDSITNPLDSPDIVKALESLAQTESCVVLIIDQFEELLFKEELSDVFNAVKELSLDIDARQVPVVLGFAWKTDISPPQMHPAYHMWHDLEGRRRTFKIREFGPKDIGRIIAKTEKAAGKKLSPALRSRIIEQSNNLPWWLKKLLVHVLKRVTDTESQYRLLERELDVETLFKEDLQIPAEEVSCLKYVAARSPVSVVEVDESFPREITTRLINANLLVKSGMNFVIYWDLFRDYLIDERNVPHIPWARMFRYGPSTALRMLHRLGELGPMTVPSLAQNVQMSEGTCFNIISDLAALQLVELKGNGIYAPASHLSDLSPSAIARCVQSQLRRHIVVSEFIEQWEMGKLNDTDTWLSFFTEINPQTSSFSRATIRHYANTLRRWLLFAGILEEQGRWLIKPVGSGRQLGLITLSPSRSSIFLGTSAPRTMASLLSRLHGTETRLERRLLVAEGLRNAISDATALGLVIAYPDGSVMLSHRELPLDQILQQARICILEQPASCIISDALAHGITDGSALGKLLQEELHLNWKPVSGKRYASGIRRYLAWAQGKSQRSKGQEELDFLKDH